MKFAIACLCLLVAVFAATAAEPAKTNSAPQSAFKSPADCPTCARPTITLTKTTTTATTTAATTQAFSTSSGSGCSVCQWFQSHKPVRSRIRGLLCGAH